MPDGSGVSAPLLEVENLTVRHRSSAGPVTAVDGVSFTLRRGQTLGLVGESGCGKSTLARTIIGLNPATSGSIRFDGREIGKPAGLLARGPKNAGGRRWVTRRLQMVFQDPLLSLNPRATVGRILEEPLSVHRVGNRAQRRRRVEELLGKVGLAPDAGQRLPHEFSGGQRQRIGIARALALTPDLVICDEPVSALDLSVQAQVLNLLSDLQTEFGLSYLFISHDLGVIRHMADKVLVMYLGKIVESGPADLLWDEARHPYTRTLLAAAPGSGPGRARPRALSGEVPSPVNRPTGCAFRARCPYAQARCAEAEPALRRLGPDHAVACHFA